MSGLVRPAGAVAALQRRDRPWLNSYVAAVLGPFAMPSLEQVRDALAKLIDTYAHSRLNWRPDPSGRYWHADRNPGSIVSERIWHDGVAVGEVLDMLVRDTSMAPPLSLIRFDNYLGLKMSHGVGDGRIYTAILSRVVQTAITGEVPDWPAQPSGRFPLAAAASRTFGRHPSLIKASMADRYRKEYHRPAETSRPWYTSRRTIATSIARPQRDEIDAMAKRSGASRLGVQICLTLRALRNIGLKVSSDVHVVVDLRRYLGWRFIDGNFLAGVPIRLTADMTPEQITAKVLVTIRSGRPLAGQLLSSLRSGISTTAQARSVDPEAPVTVTFSSLATPEFDALPVLSGRSLVACGSVEPDGPRGLTFLLVETTESTWINASFHDNVIEAHQLQQALESLTADPARLLYAPADAS